MKGLIQMALAQSVLAEVLAERMRQIEKFGDQVYPLFSTAVIENSKPGQVHRWFSLPCEADAKMEVDMDAAAGVTSFFPILLEEVCEVAGAAHDIQQARRELIQVAAVAVAAIQSIDRKLQ